MTTNAPPIPRRLAQRPRWRGLPIPYITFIAANGDPDFRVTDPVKRFEVIGNKWCQLCGEPLGRFMFFTGGPEAFKHLQYYEPATHLNCLIYAMQVCPFIASSRQHADLAEVQADNPTAIVYADPTYSTVKSEWWILVKAGGFKQVPTPGGEILLRPEPVMGKTMPLKAEIMRPDDWKLIHRHLASNPVPWLP